MNRKSPTLTGDSETSQVYKNGYFSIRTEKDQFKIFCSDGRLLLDRFEFTYGTCSVHNLREPIGAAPDHVIVDTVSGLHVGDLVSVQQDIYGGAENPVKAFGARIVEISEADRKLALSPAPSKMRFSHDLAVYMIKQEERPSRYSLLGAWTREKDGQALRMSREYSDFVLNLCLLLRNDSPKITFKIQVSYKCDLQIYHQTLSFFSRLRVSEIYKKNRQVEIVSGAPEAAKYWLWKEGCRFSEGASTLFTIHNPGIASVELDRARSSRPELKVHLEHYGSQRFRHHVRKRNTGFVEFQELSAPTYRNGEKADYTFNLYAGTRLSPPPRLKLSRNRFKATQVWTEHADQTHIRSHRAVYFGHEDITDPESARGGFVYYGHPVTKSIFYANPTGNKNPLSENGGGKEFGACLSYQESAEFRTFLDNLRRLGNEICLHTATPAPAGRWNNAKALSKITKRYGSRVWIDHNMQFNRTCISADGLNPRSWCYMKDVWEKKDIRYYWHYASEDYMWKNKRNLDLLHCRDGHATPTPVYWRHPTVLGPFLTWGTNESYLEHFTKNAIDELVKNWGVCIHHHYYPFLCVEVKSFLFYYRDLHGKLIVTRKFDEVLEYMSALREVGDLDIATVGEMMDYWMALEGVEIDVLRDDKFSFTNRSGKDIPGFSFAVRGNVPVSRDVAFSSRTLENGDQLIWFDFKKEHRAEFQLSPP